MKVVFDYEADIKNMCRLVKFNHISICMQCVAFVPNLKIHLFCSSLIQQSMKASADNVAEVLVEVDACSLNEVQL